MRIQSERGVNLIELVIVIVILAIAIPVLLSSWADISWKMSRSEALADATFFAQQLMEEVRSKAFVDPEDKTTKTLGADSAESYPKYDDVDDYNGYSDTPAAGYTRCVTIDYVQVSGSSWVGTCSPSTPTSCSTPSCSPGNATDFKRITVRVSRQDNLARDVTLVTVVSNYQSS